MIDGVVTEDGTPIITLPVANREWTTIVDTGFNGDIELPNLLREHVNADFAQMIISDLAGGRQIVEAAYFVDFPFDGSLVRAVATFVDGDEILLGTGLLGDYILTIDFPKRSLVLKKI